VGFKIVQYIFWCVVAFFSYLLLLISFQYVNLKLDVAFLVTKTTALQFPIYKYAFFTHVFTAIFTLVLGIPLFSNWVRKHSLQVHKLLGKLYVITVLCFAGLSGLVMSFFANGGIVAITSFVLLSILWLWFTYKAYSFARRKNRIQHRAFMYRSYALALSAITLRLLKWAIANTLAPPPMDTYVLVAWLSWTINLAIAEYLIYKMKCQIRSLRQVVDVFHIN
jgi:uncharacterized membrane protein